MVVFSWRTRIERSYLVQRVRRLDGGGSAVLDAEFHIDLFQVLVDRAGAQSQDFADIAIGFALGNPEKDLCLADGQRKSLPKSFIVACLADAC